MPRDPIPRCSSVALARCSAKVGAALVILASLQPACIFFVPTAGPLKTSACSFSGAKSTACGICVAESCASEVDACCTTGSCKGNLSYLDSCAGSGDSSACDTLTMGLVFDDPSGNFATLGNCVAKCPACAASANGSGPGSGTGTGSTSGIACTTSGDSCNCLASGSSSGSSECDPSTFGGGVCCAQTNYPAVFSTSCQCAAYACGDDGEGDCYCSANPGDISGTTPTSSCDDSQGGVCCVSNEGDCSCFASQTSCGGGTQVSVCQPGSSACGVGTMLVSSCSNP